MTDRDPETFETTKGGLSDTYPVDYSSLRRNGHVVLKGRPCKIVDISTSKTGKHGHAKVHIVGIDMLTNKKIEDIIPSTDKVMVPVIYEVVYTLVNIDEEGYMELKDDAGITRRDIKLPANDMAGEIKKQFKERGGLSVTVLQAVGEEAVIGYK